MTKKKIKTIKGSLGEGLIKRKFDLGLTKVSMQTAILEDQKQEALEAFKKEIEANRKKMKSALGKKK